LTYRRPPSTQGQVLKIVLPDRYTAEELAATEEKWLQRKAIADQEQGRELDQLEDEHWSAFRDGVQPSRELKYRLMSARRQSGQGSELQSIDDRLTKWARNMSCSYGEVWALPSSTGVRLVEL
jgi:hypothetical protein